MLKLAILFFIISVVAGALGFTGVSEGAGRIAKVLFFVFMTLFVLAVAAIILGIQVLT
ncbi:MAG: hypothetical protein JWN71_2805 [Xanthobacteraceae bacterium]|jgi:uncharacterized membrane protein YtjA (UPF0391 family)|nr:hypothetical protein [Xanthobacteraceae bacterium]